jgi:5-methylcytosine-specific restriction endonuclease McrA
MGDFDFFGGTTRTRRLGKRERDMLFMAAKGKCQNPYCKTKITEAEMQIGHKTAFSRRGNTTLKNSVCLCYRCNRLQGTDSWEKFLKKQAIAHGQALPREKKVKKITKKIKPKRTRKQNDFWDSGDFPLP